VTIFVEFLAITFSKDVLSPLGPTTLMFIFYFSNSSLAVILQNDAVRVPQYSVDGMYCNTVEIKNKFNREAENPN
jgi:hypothetical protein